MEEAAVFKNLVRLIVLCTPIYASAAQPPGGQSPYKVIAVDASKLAQYAGVFRIDPQMAFTFVVQDQKLYGRLSGQAFTALTAAAPDVFTLAQYGAEFRFGRENGKVTTMTLRQGGVDYPARRTAEPPPALAFDKALKPETYAGHYLSPANGAPRISFDVSVSDGQMLARVDQQPFLPVFPVPGKADRFAWDVAAAELRFERDAGGAVNALVLHQDGQTILATRKSTTANAQKGDDAASAPANANANEEQVVE
jgi:hypothetical protein